MHCRICWRHLHTSPHCSLMTYIQLGSREPPIRELTCTLITCKPDLLCFFLPFSMHLYLLHLFPYGMVSMETEIVGEKKYSIESEWVVFFFSLTLPLSLSVSLPLPCSLKVKQCVERSISLINTTQQHSALRGEMKRHGGMSTCRPGVVLTNDTYHTSHGWEQGQGRRDREGLEKQTERDR